MRQGFDIDKIKGTVKEAVLLKSLWREEQTEHLRTMLNYQSNLPLTDESVDTMQNLIDLYHDVVYPEKKKDPKQQIQEEQEMLKDMEKMSLDELYQKHKHAIGDEDSIDRKDVAQDEKVKIM